MVQHNDKQTKHPKAATKVLGASSSKLTEAQTNTSKFMTGKIFLLKKSHSTCGEETFAEEEAKATENKLSSNNNIYASSLSDFSSNKVGFSPN